MKGFKASKRFSHRKKGVAAVIGTMLSLMVFLSIFVLIMSQIVPQWMQSYEAAYENEVEWNMLSFDHATTLSSLTNSTKLIMASPFEMQSSGIPLISPPTNGFLTFDPGDGLMFANIFIPNSPGNGNGGSYIINPPSFPALSQMYGGSLKMFVPVRYLSYPETLIYQNSAIMVTAGSSNAIRISPEFKIITIQGGSGTYYELYIGLYAFYGSPASSSGPGTQVVYTQLLGVQQYKESYTNTPAVYLYLYEKYQSQAHAWVSWIWNYMNQTGVGNYISVSSIQNSAGGYDITFTIQNMAKVDVVISSYELSFHSISNV
ncbi:MAG: hypothetical protein ACP5MW_02575 [Thermoplasmata archaeon]